MRKSKLRSGEKIHVVTVGHYVKASDFAHALRDHFYNKGDTFPNTLTKKRAEEILRDSLFFHGLSGQYSNEEFESST